MSIKKLQVPQFRSFHAIAALRGDGLRPELVQLFERLAQGADANLSGVVEAAECELETGCVPLVRSKTYSRPEGLF